MREIVLDTETTGLDPRSGDRVVEIACLELVNHLPTGRTYHQYVNPERAMPAEAFAVHGLSDAFLAGHPVFATIAADFLAFVGDAPIVIHNASFDIAFLNHEIAGIPGLVERKFSLDRAIDTLELARRKHPFGPNSLDALCRRYGIDNSSRTLHGALLDCELLAEIYLELIGGRQPGLGLDSAKSSEAVGAVHVRAEQRPTALPSRLTADDLKSHGAFVATLGEKALWREFGDGGAGAA